MENVHIQKLHVYGIHFLYMRASIYTCIYISRAYARACIYKKWLLYIHNFCIYTNSNHPHRYGSVHIQKMATIYTLIYKIFICTKYDFHIYLHIQKLFINEIHLPYMHTSIYMCVCVCEHIQNMHIYGNHQYMLNFYICTQIWNCEYMKDGFHIYMHTSI